MIPFPDTPDASSLSHIIFSSLKRSEVRSVLVIGSASGRHTGRLTALPDGAGTAFLPSDPFTPGEHASVTATLSSPAAGTASGDPGATVIHFSFTVAVAVRPNSAAADRPPMYALSMTTGPPTKSFRSAPDLHPPAVSATSNPDSTSGDIFLTAENTLQNGLMILDSRGQLVWFRQVSGFATNLEVQQYRGQAVLTWWQQKLLPNHVYSGTNVIMSRSYKPIAMLDAGYGYLPDLHEFQLTPRGTALIEANPRVRANLSSIGGPAEGVVIDCVIQELNVTTNRVLWEWHALGHIPLSSSYAGHGGTAPFDYCHLNSIQQLPNGNLLISARDTWAVYEINKQTGRIIWTLGGNHSSFHMGAGTNFEWQHDAHLIGDTLTLFDDGALPQEERQSSGKVLRLDTTSMTTSLVRRYAHSPSLLVPAAGSMQILPNHGVFVGWGRQPDFSEYTLAGKQIFNGSFPLGVYSYRAYRFPWSGQPRTRPALAVSPQRNGSVNVYMSWNGATDVAVWRVRGGSRPGGLRSLSQIDRTGFETVMTLPNRPRYVAVQALNARGKVIGTSPVRKV